MTKKLRSFLSAIGTCLTLGCAHGADNPAATDRITINFRDASIQEVFDVLSRKDRLNIVLGRGVTGNVSVNLYDVTVHDAIHRIAQAGGYTVEYRDGSYAILERQSVVADNSASHQQVRTFKVNYSDPTQIAGILVKHISPSGKVTPLTQRRMIVVEDQPAVIERVAKILEELDRQPLQVLIEAKVLEVVLDDGEAFGINWNKVFNGATAKDTTGSFGTTGLAQGSIEDGPARSGFFVGLVNSNVTLFLEAQATKSRVRTISSPRLLAIENQEAKAVIGNSTGYKVTTTINQVTTESVQFLESGVILRVTPSVDQQGRILLKVHPEVSTASLSSGVPSKKSTEVTTEFLCEDGQSVFIGGLIKRISSLEETGVPGLSRLPVLGRLFSSTNDSVAQSETVVIISPRIVRDMRELGALSSPRLEQTERASQLILEQRLRLSPDTLLSDPQETPNLPPAQSKTNLSAIK